LLGEREKQEGKKKKRPQAKIHPLTTTMCYTTEKKVRRCLWWHEKTTYLATRIHRTRCCRTRHRDGRLKIINLWKRTDFWHSVLWWRTVLFKESPPSIMVTRNPNWSIEILWFGTGYVKGNILSPPKRPAWGRLHC